jgi:hypothetical protein
MLLINRLLNILSVFLILKRMKIAIWEDMKLYLVGPKESAKKLGPPKAKNYTLQG